MQVTLATARNNGGGSVLASAKAPHTISDTTADTPRGCSQGLAAELAPGVAAEETGHGGCHGGSLSPCPGLCPEDTPPTGPWCAELGPDSLTATLLGPQGPDLAAPLYVTVLLSCQLLRDR